MKTAVIVGAGFFGCSLALHLVRHHRFSKVTILEREKKVLAKASFYNQARVHQGYHYPRAYGTAQRSAGLFAKFNQDYGDCVKSDFAKVYGIPKQQSAVTATQFERFCHEIGAPLVVAGKAVTRLFDMEKMEQVYLAEEYAFNANILAEMLLDKIAQTPEISLKLNARCFSIKSTKDKVDVQYCQSEMTENIVSDLCLNCTYSAIEHSGAGSIRNTLRHEVTEISIVDVPEDLKQFGFTIMDGPFFSLMPFPAISNRHSFSHVRYTPHYTIDPDRAEHPYSNLENYIQTAQSNFSKMKAHASGFIPQIAEVTLDRTHYQTKTVLTSEEKNDGRPTLFEVDPSRTIIHVMGGKLVNIYDALSALDEFLDTLD